MSKAVRTILSLVVSMVLFNAVAMAHAGGDHIDKHKKENKEHHHSPFSKLAFWHHHKHNDKSVKTVRANHPQQKQAQVKAAQTKPAPPAMAASKKDQKHEQHAKSQAPVKKTSAGTKTKPQEKAQGHTPA